MMKNKFYFVLSITLLVGLIAIPLSCKKKPFDDLAVNVDTDVFSSPMVVMFENAKEDATVQPTSDFTVTITGKDKDKVISPIGLTSFQAHDGWISLSLAQGVVASPENPISFTINASITGFEDLKKDVVIETTDEVKIIAKVIEKGNLPAGIVQETQKISISNGAFTSVQNITTSETNGTTESVSLTFGAGTKMLDKNGNPISGANVDANVRFYDVTDESINVFPGGLSPRNVFDKDGKEIEGGVNFFTAGLMDVDLKIGNTEVKKFDNPVAAEMKLNPNQDNFTTGELVKAGDRIPLWSLNETTGEWTEEDSATVVSSNGGLVAQFEITHLSCWNLDWGWSAFGKYATNNKKLDVKICASDLLLPYGNYEVTMRTPNGRYLGALHGTSLYHGFIASFANTPNTPQVYVEVRDNLNGKIVGKSGLFNPSTKTNLELCITPPSEKLVNIKLTYSLVCTKNPKVKPNASAYLVITDLETNKKSYHYTGVTNNKNSKGRLDLRLVQGRKYRVTTTGIDGKLISCESILDINNLQPQEIKGLNIKKLKYNSNSSTVEIDCEYVTSKC